MNVGSGSQGTGLANQLDYSKTERDFFNNVNDLSVSNDVLFEQAYKLGQKDDPLMQMKIQQAMNKRNQLISLLTSLLKMFHDLMMTIIRNFRLN